MKIIKFIKENDVIKYFICSVLAAIFLTLTLYGVQQLFIKNWLLALPFITYFKVAVLIITQTLIAGIFVYLTDLNE